MFKISYTTRKAKHCRPSFMLVAAGLMIALCGLSTAAWAAPTFVNAADPDLPGKARGLPKGGALNIQDFNLDGEGDVTLELVRYSVFADDAFGTIVSDSGTTEVSPPADVYFRGWANHDPNSIVVLTIAEDGSTRGVITGTNGAWLLESHPGKGKSKGKGLNNRKVDVATEFADREFSCGVESSSSASASGNEFGGAEGAAAAAFGIPTNVKATAHIIVDTDFEYFQLFGSGPSAAAAALAYMGDLFAYSSAVYEREIDTNLVISQYRLFSTNHDPYVETTTGCIDYGTLDELQDEWKDNPTPRTLVQLLSGKPGGGCAYVGVLCHQDDGYGTNMGISGGNFNIDNPAVIWDNTVVAHEIGHNFNSPHTHNYCDIGGIAEPVDICAAVEENCDAGIYPSTGLPGAGSLTGGTPGSGNGTIMSYCHLQSQGFANVSWTFGEFHPDGVAPFRVPDRMRAHVAANVDANPSCMTLQYTGPDLAVFKDCKPDSPALVGTTGICTIVVENKGTEIALGVVSEDLFLSNGTFNFGTVTATKGVDLMAAGTCTASANPQNQSGDVSCDLGDLAAGHKVTIKIPVTALSPQNVNDRVTVDSESPDPNMSNNMAEDTLTFIENADLAVSKLCKPDGDLLAGETGTCTIIVQNFGPSPAANVSVVDTHVSNKPFTIDSVSPGPATCNIADSVVSCSYAELPAGDSRTIVISISEDEPMDINNTVTVTSDTADSNTANNTASDGLHIVGPKSDLAVSKLCKPDGDLLAGEMGTCTIVVQNFGPQPAANVSVVDTHVSNKPFTIDNVSPGPTTCNIADSVVSCSYDSLPVGDSQTIVISISEDEPMDINNTVTVTSASEDSNTANNTASDGLHIVGLADLSITKADAPDPVIAGEDLTYTINVNNAGPSTASNVVVTDVLPAGTSIVSVTPSAGSCNVGVPGDPAQPLLCTLGNIASAGSGTVTIVLKVLPGTTGVLNNTASVSSDTADNDQSNNQASASTTVNVVTDLSNLSKSDSPDPVIAGAELKYLVTLKNDGPSTATNVVLTDVLPPETSLMKYKVLGGTDNCIHSSLASDTVTCTVGTLGPGQSFVLTISVLVDPSTPHGTAITNNVTVTESGGPGSQVSENTLVNAAADLWIDKTGGFITQNPSKNILYTLTVHNDKGCSGDDPQVCGNGGPSDAQNVVVVDTLPSTNKKLVVVFVSEACVYNQGTHKVTCTTPVLAAGDSVVHQIEATPKGKLNAINNIATVSSTTNDPNGGNNTDNMILVVGGGGQKGTGE